MSRRRVVIVSTYPPRRCGLASFAEDLRAALAMTVPRWRTSICAIDRHGFAYGPAVETVVAHDDQPGYRRAAKRIAAAGADLALIQHEYGIFGGPDGAYVLDFVDELRRCGVRYAVTVHTVVAQPSPARQAILAELCSSANAVTVFTAGARDLVLGGGLASPDRVFVAPHGAPTVLRRPARTLTVRPLVARVLNQVGDAPVLATFGLIGPGKGLEHAIAAMPSIAQRHPRVRYLIAGATHPDELRQHGETYRHELEALADRLGVADRVHFLDAFLTEPELSVLLARTDLYLTPYPVAEQACSGALTFALAAGRPVVSTAYRYAEEMLSAGSATATAAPGVLVPCADPMALGRAVADLLADPARMAAAHAAANRLGATLTWPAVAANLARRLESLVDAAGRPAPAGEMAGPRLMTSALAHGVVGNYRLG